MRCGGELPEGAGYYHLVPNRCIEVLGRRVAELDRRLSDCAEVVYKFTGHYSP